MFSVAGLAATPTEMAIFFVVRGGVGFESAAGIGQVAEERQSGAAVEAGQRVEAKEGSGVRQRRFKRSPGFSRRAPRPGERRARRRKDLRRQGRRRLEEISRGPSAGVGPA